MCPDHRETPAEQRRRGRGRVLVARGLFPVFSTKTLPAATSFGYDRGMGWCLPQDQNQDIVYLSVTHSNLQQFEWGTGEDNATPRARVCFISKSATYLQGDAGRYETIQRNVTVRRLRPHPAGRYSQ